MHFSDLGLMAEIQRAVAEQGYHTPTPIQQQAIPAVLAGHDLMATAQTGTGKTAGFTLPILHRLAAGANGRLTRVARTPRVLVLTPTRELAIQVEESVRTYGKHLPVQSLAVFGGVGINLAIQDAVAAANILAGPMARGGDPDPLLAKVQKRRMFPVKVIQAMQRTVHRTVLRAALAGTVQKAPWPVRLLGRTPLLQRIPARVLGLGVRREHIRSPDAGLRRPSPSPLPD